MWIARHSKALLLALALTSPAAASTLADLEERYREILQTWTEGEIEAAEELLAFQQLVADAHAGRTVNDTYMAGRPTGDGRRSLLPGGTCLERIERYSRDSLFALDPDAALPLFILHLRAWAIAVRRPGSLWLADRLEQQLGLLLEGHQLRGKKERAGGRARQDLVLMLLTLGDEMRAQGRVVAAVDSAARHFEKAWRLEPESLTAAYWAAVVREYLAHTRQARRHLEKLAAMLPDDHEVHLRLALNQIRERERRPAEKTLRRLAADPEAADWIRIVAYQELARLLDQPAARELLEEARASFPEDPQLALQLAARLGDDWDRVDALAAEVAAHPEAAARASARLRYDMPRRDEIDRARLAIEERTEELLPTLASTLRTLSHTPIVRPNQISCRSVPLPSR